MALKDKVLSFLPDSNMFIGSNHDNEGKIGIVTFGDNCKYTEIARKKTDETLKFDNSYKILQTISNKPVYDKGSILKNRAFTVKTEIWCILFHNFLIEVLRQNGWTIIPAPDGYAPPTNLTKNHMII